MLQMTKQWLEWILDTGLGACDRKTIAVLKICICKGKEWEKGFSFVIL